MGGGPHCRLSRLYAVAYSDGEAAEFATAIRFGILFNGIKQHQKVLLGQAIVLLQHLNREQAALARPPVSPRAVPAGTIPSSARDGDGDRAADT
ncbi:hypothetical protein CEQ31_026230 [Serratia odorifera]|nr:hypothetical protein CEQ31_026230 [Serratia odorifera]